MAFGGIPIIGDIYAGLTGETAAEAAAEAGEVSAQAQLAQLEYLKEINRLPQQYREAALTQLATMYC